MDHTVQVRYGERSQWLAKPADIDDLLDNIVQQVGEPTYVDVITSSPALVKIGLGRADYSILMYLDIHDSDPMISTGTLHVRPGENYFADEDGTQTLIPRDSAIPLTDALTAIREFVTTGTRPTNITWRPEPPATARHHTPNQHHVHTTP